MWTLTLYPESICITSTDTERRSDESSSTQNFSLMAKNTQTKLLCRTFILESRKSDDGVGFSMQFLARKYSSFCRSLILSKQRKRSQRELASALLFCNFNGSFFFPFSGGLAHSTDEKRRRAAGIQNCRRENWWQGKRKETPRPPSARNINPDLQYPYISKPF